MIELLPWKDLLMSSSWLAKWARQWTHEYVLQHLIYNFLFSRMSWTRVDV